MQAVIGMIFISALVVVPTSNSDAQDLAAQEKAVPSTLILGLVGYKIFKNILKRIKLNRQQGGDKDYQYTDQVKNGYQGNQNGNYGYDSGKIHPGFNYNS
ncbi:hypothetical protein DSO57_1031949 [Entomophthora muscae]|uniref:Uncharacterized protein n=1 Tax=Entomophthora muscae TaxID=34485 RepID=A0ACC2TYE1_9FUNG|nr:hypothetical protein DSO57_1031949 [Entomophthora muscae]